MTALSGLVRSGDKAARSKVDFPSTAESRPTPKKSDVLTSSDDELSVAAERASFGRMERRGGLVLLLSVQDARDCPD